MEPYRHETMMMGDYDIVSDIIDTMMEIYDEYDGSKKYIMEAIKLKPIDKARADSLVTMSAQEKGHGDNMGHNAIGSGGDNEKEKSTKCCHCCSSFIKFSSGMSRTRDKTTKL